MVEVEVNDRHSKQQTSRLGTYPELKRKTIALLHGNDRPSTAQTYT